MRRSRRLRILEGMLLCVGLLWVHPAPAQVLGGLIEGDVWAVENNTSISPVYRGTVYFRRADNATLAGEVALASGHFVSPELPPGDYKIFLDAVSPLDRECTFWSGYYGTTGASFDAGSAVTVTSGGINTLPRWGITDWHCPSLAVIYSLSISGTVSNSITQLPLDGVEVQVLDAETAWETPCVAKEGGAVTTAADGTFVTECRLGADAVKVRFVDPMDRVLSEFHGAGGKDLFTLGVSLATDMRYEITELMSPDTPAGATVDLAADLAAGGLGSISDTVNQSVTLLADQNPNNDRAACGLLSAFERRLNTKVRNGEMTEAEAAAFLASSQEIRASLGCR